MEIAKGKRRIQESYAKDESVKEKPGDDEAEGEVNRDEKMPRIWLAIVSPDRLHGRLGTRIRASKASTRSN